MVVIVSKSIRARFAHHTADQGPPGCCAREAVLGHLPIQFPWPQHGGWVGGLVRRIGEADRLQAETRERAVRRAAVAGGAGHGEAAVVKDQAGFGGVQVEAQALIWRDHRRRVPWRFLDGTEHEHHAV